MFKQLKNSLDNIADSTFHLQLGDDDIEASVEEGGMISPKSFGKNWQSVIKNSRSVGYYGKYGRVKIK